ncbi:hypothetical protein FB446DRAFT_608422, partial [Lentinula raphanica]
KLFNLNTYKFHALGDYPWTIRTFGTTDSYSTQLVRVINELLNIFSYYIAPRVNWNIGVSRGCMSAQTNSTL